MVLFTTIYHKLQHKYGLSVTEYVFLNFVQFLQASTGWCYMSREEMAKNICISERHVFRVILKVERAGLLVRSEKGVKVTAKWLDGISDAKTGSPKEGEPGGEDGISNARKNISEFVGHINLLTSKGHKTSPALAGALEERIRSGYTLDDLKKAVTNACSDAHHIESNFKYITPEFMLREEKIEYWLNASVRRNYGGTSRKTNFL